MMKADFDQSPSAGGGVVSPRPNPWRWRALVRVAAFAVLSGLMLFFGGFGLFATHVSHLVTPKNLPKADAIIVLTGGQSRLSAAFDLLKSGKGQRLLISGVHPAADKDDLRAASGGNRKLFNCCVDIDHAALDTIGNAEESAKWVRDHDYEKVILVTNNYHMPRSLLEMGRFLGKAELEPYPVVNSDLNDGNWIKDRDALRVLFTEYNKLILALVRGIVPLRPAGDSVRMVHAGAVPLH